ncbi:MAG: hypothetical protein DDT21_01019 [Syntrophomonadaceae bacterium]|nr:hypothetical protein [Bacillota bacterium]
MQCLLQRIIQTRVSRSEGGMIVAETAGMEKGVEQTVILSVEPDSFLVREARLETFVTPADEAVIPLQQLRGVKAYLDGGSGLKSALKSLDRPVASLVAEAVRGVVQAETYLLKERGFNSSAEYSNYWENMYAGSCRYYSNLERILHHWDEYAGSRERRNQLFLRSKTYLLYGLGPNHYLTIGSLVDTFHELNVRLETNNAVIGLAEADFLRVPDPVCAEAASFLANLAGTDLRHLRKKDLAHFLGGGQGCIHLIDIIDDCIDTFASISS